MVLSGRGRTRERGAFPRLCPGHRPGRGRPPGAGPAAAARRPLLARDGGRRSGRAARGLDRGRAGGAGDLLPGAAGRRRAEPDQPAGARTDAARAEPAAGLRRLAEGSAQRRHAGTAVRRRAPRRDPERHCLRRGLARPGGSRFGGVEREPLGRPRRAGRAGVPGGAVGRLGRGVGDGQGRAGAAGHRDERRAARGRRADPDPGDQLQGRGLFRRRHAMPADRLSRPRRPHRLRRRPGGELGRAAPDPCGRASGGAGSGELSQQGRPAGERRRSGHAGGDGRRAGPAGGRRLSRHRRAGGQRRPDAPDPCRPDQLAHRPGPAAGRRQPVADRLFRRLFPAALGPAGRDRKPLGRARARPVLRPGRDRLRPFRPVGAGLRSCRRRRAAGPRLQHRPGRDLSQPRPGAAAQLPRLLFLAARKLRRAGDRPHGQARQPGMAAGQGGGAVGNLLARGGAGAPAPCLSLHRQRPRRGHPGQAPGAGGDRRPPDAATHPGGKLWPAARSRGACRRIL